MQDRLGASPAYRIVQSVWAAVDWLYPPKCGGCQQPGTRWCPECARKAQKIDLSSICPVCGIPQTGFHTCADCRANPPPFRELRSWAVYQGPVREAIRRLKYHSDLGLSDIFARKLAEIFMATGWVVDLVTVVPLGRGRILERGFNQADLLARGLALAIQRPYRPAALKRVRETASQVGLNARERLQNVQDAFEAEADIVTAKNLLIVDDVTTTSATISECSRACLQKNAYNVYGLTVARAVIDQSS